MVCNNKDICEWLYNAIYGQVTEDVLPDWTHHGAASWNRRCGQGFFMRHTKGFKFNNTEIDIQ